TVWVTGSQVEVLWSDKDFGGVKIANIYLLEDHGNDDLKRALTIGENVNLSKGSYTFKLPRSFKAGNYAVTITDDKKFFKYSHPFKITHG
ncbi:2233_t:CDS:2, partial [Acaulospora morrowiae]